MVHDRATTELEEGRTFDIDYVNWDDQVEGTALLTFGDVSKKTTGLVKAVNKFIKILLTRVGSDPFSRNLGTVFEDILYRGGDSDTELGTFISEQLNSALQQLSIIQSDTSAFQDEIITSATLTEIIRTGDLLSVRINIVSEAGQGANIVLPVIGG